MLISGNYDKQREQQCGEQVERSEHDCHDEISIFGIIIPRENFLLTCRYGSRRRRLYGGLDKRNLNLHGVTSCAVAGKALAHTDDVNVHSDNQRTYRIRQSVCIEEALCKSVVAVVVNVNRFLYVQTAALNGLGAFRLYHVHGIENSRVGSLVLYFQLSFDFA